MAKCLVVGGNGFLGSHLVDALAADGHELTVFDHFATDPQFSADARAVHGNFTNDDALADVVPGHEYVYHFLSMSTPASADLHPADDVLNIRQSVSLLQQCADAGVERFYFSSTGGAIYGPTTKSTLAETDPAAPISPYGIGKLAIENYLSFFRAKHGLQSFALRISNPFGPRQHPERKQGLIPIVLRNVAQGAPVVRLGDGSMVRDYIYVEDVVQMVTQMTRTVPTESIYNLGSGSGLSVNEVFDAITEVTGRELQIVDQPQPASYVDRIVLDIDRYSAEFGAPELTDLHSGIAKTWQEIETHG